MLKKEPFSFIKQNLGFSKVWSFFFYYPLHMFFDIQTKIMYTSIKQGFIKCCNINTNELIK